MNNRTHILQTVLLAAFVVLPVSILCAQSDRRGPATAEKYRLLSERNIFLRYRRRPQKKVVAPAPRKPAPPPDPDRYIKLTGTAVRGGDRVAFLEDSRSDRTLQVRVGEAVGKGKITAVTLDGIQYQRDGRAGEIEIGRTLSGSLTIPAKTGLVSAERPAAPSSAPAAGESSSRSAETGDGGAGIADILERMRKRRQQELEQ